MSTNNCSVSFWGGENALEVDGGDGDCELRPLSLTLHVLTAMSTTGGKL